MTRPGPTSTNTTTLPWSWWPGMEVASTLTTPYAGSAKDVVAGLLAVQAENPGQAAWAVACRTSRPNADDLAKLLDDGTILRTHVLRPTWHFVAAADVRWLLPEESGFFQPLLVARRPLTPPDPP